MRILVFCVLVFYVQSLTGCSVVRYRTDLPHGGADLSSVTAVRQLQGLWVSIDRDNESRMTIDLVPATPLGAFVGTAVQSIFIDHESDGEMFDVGSQCVWIFSGEVISERNGRVVALVEMGSGHDAGEFVSADTVDAGRERGVLMVPVILNDEGLEIRSWTRSAGVEMRRVGIHVDVIGGAFSIRPDKDINIAGLLQDMLDGPGVDRWTSLSFGPFRRILAPGNNAFPSLPSDSDPDTPSDTTTPFQPPEPTQ